MSFEFIVFIIAILFGITLYWRESKGNRVYFFFNKLLNSEKLQQNPNSRKGFIFQQTFLLRLVFISLLFIVVLALFQFLIPISFNAISMIASSITGTLLGTYLAHFIIKSGIIIEEQTENLENIVSETYEKGKDFIEDITEKKTLAETPEKEVESSKKEPGKSARERLKEKGLM